MSKTDEVWTPKDCVGLDIEVDPESDTLYSGFDEEVELGQGKKERGMRQKRGPVLFPRLVILVNGKDFLRIRQSMVTGNGGDKGLGRGKREER